MAACEKCGNGPLNCKGQTKCADCLMAESEPLFPKKTIYFLECRTGCSCCSDENITCGPYATKEEAEDRMKEAHNISFRCSQYSKHGVYMIHEEEGEFLPDGRIICEGEVYGGCTHHLGSTSLHS